MKESVRKLMTSITSLRITDYTMFFCRVKSLDLTLTILSGILAEDVIVAADNIDIEDINFVPGFHS